MRQDAGDRSFPAPEHTGADDNVVRAGEIMTRDIVSVYPDAPIRAIARLMLDKGISAVPVVDSTGAPLGIVSEGDLIGRADSDREARKDWWLSMLAEGEALNPDFLTNLRASERIARDVMSGPVVTVAENTEASEIGRLLQSYRIKRVPVVRDGRVVGIVSRADLLRSLAGRQQPTPSHKDGYLAGAIAGLDERFFHHRQTEQPVRSPPPEPDDGGVKAADFQRLVEDFERRETVHREEVQRAAAALRRRHVVEIIDDHISNDRWRALVHQARQAAENGEKEFMMFRFPSQVCSDGGRAINVTEPGWPATLRGDAAEIYLRWEHDLKPRGFHLAARVMEYPDGMPGDIGLFLIW
ncbi:MAG: CBS domain-containing protein [Xanthobacteraceae bacterium]